MSQKFRIAKKKIAKTPRIKSITGPSSNISKSNKKQVEDYDLERIEFDNII